ncbi:MAG: hypothetical protein ABI091_19475, partial [Ferruginibacter sp.]
MILKRTFFILLIFTLSCNQHIQKNIQKENNSVEKTVGFSLDGKTPLVYSTAENTNERLTLTDSLKFVDHPQPLETEVCVFVDPDHQ